MKTNHLGIKGWTQWFLPRFTCLPASYSSLWRFTHLEVHALIGFTRQTLNRVLHNQHKMRITQATRYLLALHRGKVKNPSQSPRSEPETITNLRLMILAAPSRLGGGNHQEQQANPAAKTRTPSASRCNHSSNALGFSPNWKHLGP